MSYSFERVGKVIEIGDLGLTKGLLIEIRPEVTIEVSGLKEHDIQSMPNMIYRKVRLTVEVLEDIQEVTDNQGEKT